MRDEITEQEMREIAERVLVPDGHSVFLSVFKHFSQVDLINDDQPKRLCGAVKSNGDVPYAHGRQAFEWVVDMTEAIDEARAKPAPLALPDVSDLSDVEVEKTASQWCVGIRAKTDDGWIAGRINRCPSGRWTYAVCNETEYLAYAAGRVVERLNRMEAEDA